MEYRYFRYDNISRLEVLLEQTVARNPKQTALIYLGRKISYSDLYRNVMAVAGYLQYSTSSGYTAAGERVAVLMPNIPQFIMAYYGILRAGRIAVPVNLVSLAGQLHSKSVDQIKVTDEIASIILDSKPRVVFMADFLYPIFRQIKIDWPCTIVVTGPADFAPCVKRLLYPLKARKDGKSVDVGPEAVQFEEVLNHGWHPTFSSYCFSVGDVAQLQYTGGSTGLPKGAMLTHASLASNAWQAREHFAGVLGEGEVFLGALPFAHVYGLTVCMNAPLLTMGATIVLQPAFNPGEAVGLIRKHKVTVFPGVNRMYEAITNQSRKFDRSDFATLRIALSGAGGIEPKVCEAFKALTGVDIIDGYGLSETSPIISAMRPEDVRYLEPGGPRNLLGSLVPGTEARLIDDDWNDVPEGQAGELAVKGPQVMYGYYNKPEETAEVFNGKWFRTGDIVQYGPGGLRFIDRKKDMAKINGKNIYPSHIEPVLREHPGVAEGYIVPVKLKDQNEFLVAVVRLNDGDTANGADIIKFMSASGKLTNYEMPRRVLIIDSFEHYKNVLKIMKYKLKKWVVAQLER